MPRFSQRRRPDPKAQMTGRLNKAQGTCFERLIEQSCRYYQGTGTAVIEKTPEPFHITRSLGDGKFQGNFAKAAQPDFKGVLRGGRMIAFEAKHSADDRISESRVTAEQAGALDSYEKAGAMCFIFVSLKMQDFFLIPWLAWKSMKRWSGRKYATAEDMKEWRVRFDGQKIRFLHEEKNHDCI